MGYDGYSIDGALKGHIDDLKDQIEDAELPRWVQSEHGGERALKRAQRTAETTAEQRSDDREYDWPPIGLATFEIKEPPTPSDILSECEDWLDDNRGRIEIQSRAKQIYFSHFELSVQVTPDGEIHDLEMMASFKNH